MIAILRYRHKLIWHALFVLLYCGFASNSFANGSLQPENIKSLIDKCDVNVSNVPAEKLKFIADNSMCGVHFGLEPQPKYQKDVNFYADESNINVKTGMSHLQGNTHVTYKNDILLADKICLLHEPNKSIALVKGNVKFTHNTAVIFADSILWDIKHNAYLQNTLFKIPMPNTNLKTAWGSAQSIAVEGDKIDLVGSSYNICSPQNPIWRLDAGTLSIDKTSHQGYATNVLFRLYEAPIFYMPVFYFPLGKGRYSGFLYPKISYSNIGKVTLKIPYYFNLAPNYDAIVTGGYYGSRGFFFQNYSRFLTTKSAGSFHFMQWPNDSEFSSFKTDFASTFSADESVGAIELTDSLSKAANNRKFLYYEQNYNPIDELTLNLKYAWLSDDYMRNDFDEVRDLLPTRKIPRLLRAIFNDKNVFANIAWSQDAIVQPLGKAILKGLFSAAPDLYIRHNAYNIFGLNFKQQLHLLKFTPATDIGLSPDFNIEGTRILYEPKLEHSSRSAAHSSQIMLGAHALWYNWDNLADSTHKSYKMLMPWLSIDNKLSFTNTKQFFMTPRLLFKYVPYKYQDNFPSLDTSYNSGNYARLFSINRFAGEDRFGDTTSFVFGLENKIVSPITGLVKAVFNIGKSYDLKLHKTCLGSNCILDEQSSQHWSDWVVAANLLNDNSAWALDWAIDNKLQQTKNLYLALASQQNSKLYYHYARIIAPYDSALVTNKIVGAEHEAALNKNWSVFGNFEYDTSENNFFNYIAGLKYKSCCLDLKFGLKRRYSGVNGYGETQYKNSILFEFALPGFGA
jgi:LPS-assembly protein